MQPLLGLQITHFWALVGAGATIAGFITGLVFLRDVLLRIRRYAGLQRLLGLASRERVDIVLPKPKNVPLDETVAPLEGRLTNLGNLKAGMRIAEAVGSYKRTKDVGVAIAQAVDHADPTVLKGDVFLLGGYQGNPVTRLFLEELERRFADSVTYLDDDPHRNVIGLGQDRFEYDWAGQTRHGTPDHDYGLVVVWRNPFASRRRRLVLSVGFTSYGTVQGVEFLFGNFFHREVKRMYPRWRRTVTATEPASARPWLIPFGSPDGFAFVVKSRFEGERCLETRLVSFLDLSD